MTETNASIYVLADETLGGIKREYVEVDRKAEVGEKIVIVAKDDCEEGYENGAIFTVDRYFSPVNDHVESDEARSVDNLHGFILREEYHVLEPTDVVHIDGGRYKVVCRVAKVGDRIIVTKSHDFPKGFVSTVKGYDELIKLEDTGYGAEQFLDPANEAYRVLVPVESAEADEPQPADLIDVVSNLATRVADLERKDAAKDDLINKALSDVYTRIGRLQDEIDTLHKDNRTLGEELARLKEPAKSESIIESAPFMLVIHEGRGEFDVYQRGKKIENISRLEIEAYSRLSSTINLEFNDVGDRP